MPPADLRALVTGIHPPSGSYGDVPPPVLFNTWKHHAGALRRRIAETALDDLRDQLIVIGTELMDLYTGTLSPAEISVRILHALDAEGRLPPDVYRAWIKSGGGYQVLTLEDTCRWVLRNGEEGGRYVHLHPARWAPRTRRVRANVLKTAVLVLAHAGAHGGDPLDVKRVNAVRRRYLGLAPVKELIGDEGLGAVIDLLRSEPE